jgi:hypothetical protein
LVVGKLATLSFTACILVCCRPTMRHGIGRQKNQSWQ